MQSCRYAKRIHHRCFHVNIAKCLRTSFLQNTSVGCLSCFRKTVNFPGKHQQRRPNTFIFLINTTEWDKMKLLKLIKHSLYLQYFSNISAVLPERLKHWFSFSFKRFSVAKNCLRPKTASLNMHYVTSSNWLK